MRRLGLLIAVLAFSVLAVPSACGTGYMTDRGTIAFLRYHLISGGEITYPAEAVRQKLQGSGLFLMRLRPDGVVESVTVKMSSGYAVLDEHIIRLLKTYRFRSGTKQPIEWLVGFLQPETVIVKIIALIKEQSPPAPPKKK
jgi:TonB family protein